MTKKISKSLHLKSSNKHVFDSLSSNSAKEVLLVGLSAGLHKIYCTYFPRDMDGGRVLQERGIMCETLIW